MPFNYSGCSKEDVAGNYDLFPEGTYEFYIEAISETKTNRGSPVVEITLKPSDYAMQKSGKVWHRILLDNEWAAVNVGRFLAAIGEDPERAGEIFFTRYKGKHLVAKIKHKVSEKDGETYVNARLLPKAAETASTTPGLAETRERMRGRDTRPTPETGNGWAGENDDDIPF